MRPLSEASSTNQDENLLLLTSDSLAKVRNCLLWGGPQDKSTDYSQSSEFSYGQVFRDGETESWWDNVIINELKMRTGLAWIQIYSYGHRLQHGWTWRTLCEVKQSIHRVTKDAWFHWFKAPNVVKLRGKRQTGGCQGLGGGGNGELLFSGSRVSVCAKWKSLRNLLYNDTHIVNICTVYLIVEGRFHVTWFFNHNLKNLQWCVA